MENSPTSEPSALRAGLAWVNVLGVRVSAVNLESATARIETAIARGRKGYVCVRDAHGVIRCQKDVHLRSVHNRAFLVTPDGMPLVWALKHAGHADASRVYGPDLMLRIFEASQSKGYRHFLYGATDKTLGLLQARLLDRFPEARIVGTYAPPFHDLSPQEEADIAARINQSGADVVWVGLGSPKQELWMARMRDCLDASMLLGVGAAFDFHAGIKRQAPKIIQTSGLEWAFRLACEPRRLWRRYAVVVPSFILLTALQRLGLRQFSIGAAGGIEASALAHGLEGARRERALATPILDE